ncbi:hydroxyacid dehydrogenase [Leifsonia sp. NPDC058230]|uniref:hydroxyacid dehydrogenase n=1 Tax=Leifsonia sp. NPDC058230 TaxID=3346391 RepID=UPI0036DC6E54
MTRPRLLLDLSPELEHDLFDVQTLMRLDRVADVQRASSARVPDLKRLDADILVTGWGSAALPATLEQGARLKLIAHSAGTVRWLVPKTLVADGVRVTQAAAGMATSVAELALFFTQSLLRRLYAVDRRMVHGDWSGALGFGLGRTIAGTRIGVIGASRVGRSYIELVTALGAEVVVSDPYLHPAEARDMGVDLVELDALLASCPVVALHAPVTHETRGMLTAGRFALLQDGAVFVNTARSAIIDSAALVAELRSGRISAALDVFDVEPLPAGDPLWSLPNVMLTPHIGAVTTHSRRTQGAIVVEEIERFASGVGLRFEVNEANYDRLA